MTDTPPKPRPDDWDQFIAKDGDLLNNLQAVQRNLRQEDLLARLGNMLADLDGYVDRQAAERAQQLIAKAREAALTDIERARHEQQRAEDLVAELRRQLRVRERQVEEHQQRAEKAEAAIARAREQHPEHEGRCTRCLEPCTCLDDAEQTPDGLWNAWANVCAHGNANWPCPTIRALDDTLEDG